MAGDAQPIDRTPDDASALPPKGAGGRGDKRLSARRQRFEVVREPTDLFAVFDGDAPVEINGRILIGLAREDAVLLCELLNRGK